jgi:hypothetical protein
MSGPRWGFSPLWRPDLHQRKPPASGDYATVVYRDDVYPMSIALVPAGVRLGFIGIPDRSYTIERAPTVTGPWSTLNAQTAPASGPLEYLDTPPPPGSAFYRTVQP